jgi:hypothetical protein
MCFQSIAHHKLYKEPFDVQAEVKRVRKKLKMERKLLNIMRGNQEGERKGELPFLLHFREVTLG